MGMSMQLQGGLGSYSDTEIRSLGKSVWSSYRAPTEAETLEKMSPLFEKFKVTRLRNKREWARYALAMFKNSIRCGDELGGMTYSYDDGIRVRIYSTMSLKKIQAAFMKARNQARRRKGARDRRKAHA